MARLSGSVSDTWLSPLFSSAERCAAYSPRFFVSASIFSARFLTREPPVRALLGVARVEPFQIIFQLLVGGLDEFLQRSRREVPVLVVDRLDARAVHRQQLAPEQIKPPAQDHELPKNLFERGAIVAPEIGDGLEVRLQASAAAR